MNKNCSRILERVEKMPVRDLRGIVCKGPIGFKDFEITKQEFNDAVLYIQNNHLIKLHAIKEDDLIIMAYGVMQ